MCFIIVFLAWKLLNARSALISPVLHRSMEVSYASSLPYFLIVKNWRKTELCLHLCFRWSDEIIMPSGILSFFLSQESRKDGSIFSASTFSPGKFAIQIYLSPSPSWSIVHSISDHKLLVGEEICWTSQRAWLVKMLQMKMLKRRWCVSLIYHPLSTFIDWTALPMNQMQGLA